MHRATTMSEIKFRLELNDKPNKEGLHEVFIIIRENGKRQKVKTEVFCLNEHFGSLKAVPGSETKKRTLTWGKWITSKDKEAAYKNNQLEKKLSEYRKTYSEKKEVHGYVSKEQVISAVQAPYNLKNIIDYLDKRIKEYGETDNYQNQKGYVTAKNHLLSFIKSHLKRDSLDFREIDKAFLQKYERYLLSKKITKEKKTRSIGSVHTIMKRLRAIFNNAISEGVITPDIYPFKLYQLPTVPKTYKERLTSEELDQFENVKYDRSDLKFTIQKAFLFAVRMAGIRIEDLLSLKVKNIAAGRITYHMRKGNTNKKLKSIKITPKIQEILKHFVTKKSKPEDFIFPLMPPNADTFSNTEYKKEIGRKTSLINKYLKLIAEDACIDKNITTHIARHSFASVALKKTKDIKALQEALGHSDPKITAGYLAELNIENLDEMMDSVFD